MLLLVLSDSHGNLSNMVRAVGLAQPDMILHLGDCWRDGERLHSLFPETAFAQVPGNCDFRPAEPAERLLTLEGKRILMCHGHTYAVKQSLAPAGHAAAERKLDLFLFGHTHRALCDFHGSTLFLNPGSIGACSVPSYGVVRIDGGGIAPAVRRLE
jgi:putative phosphoesterase